LHDVESLPPRFVLDAEKNPAAAELINSRRCCAANDGVAAAIVNNYVSLCSFFAMYFSHLSCDTVVKSPVSWHRSCSVTLHN
jgi:hypothetical protein